MLRNGKALGVVIAATFLLSAQREARAADDATVTVGDDGRRFSEPPRGGSGSNPIVVDDPPRRRYDLDPPELRRSPFRLTLGPSAITTGKGFGIGVGLGADFGTGSVGGRISAAWLRGEGTNSNGTSTPTGDAIGLYSGELTLDVHRRGPLHPVIGMGVGFLRASRPDTSGWAGMGTTRIAIEYALGLDDADVRAGVSLTGGLIGPVDSDVKDLKAYAQTGVHLAIGF